MADYIYLLQNRLTSAQWRALEQCGKPPGRMPCRFSSSEELSATLRCISRS